MPAPEALRLTTWSATWSASRRGRSPPALADRAAEVASWVLRRAETTPQLYVDITGRGESIHGVFSDRVRDARVAAIRFNHGDRRSILGHDEIQLGKAYLVAQLQTLLQVGCLHLPRTPDTETLAQDLLAFEIQVSEDANDRYGAFRVGPRDDLVTALGLASQPEPPGPGIFCAEILR